MYPTCNNLNMYNSDNLVVPGGSQAAQLPPAPEQSLNFIFPSNMHLFVWSRHFKFDFQFYFICNCSWEGQLQTFVMHFFLGSCHFQFQLLMLNFQLPASLHIIQGWSLFSSPIFGGFPSGCCIVEQ